MMKIFTCALCLKFEPMKTLTLFLALIPFIGFAQFPITQEFNPSNDWTYTNGSGMQNYGGSENYATTNVGTTAYLNNANITITSPVYNLSTCAGLMNVSFPLFGQIENGYDYLRFQYRIGAGAWITIQSFTGAQNATFSYSAIPNTATQFRFLLQTDAGGPVLWYRPNGLYDTYQHGAYQIPVDISNSYYAGGGVVGVYYYDIARFTITCSAVMPVEFISFTGNAEKDHNELTWLIDSETNCDHYSVEISQDGKEWTVVGEVSANGLNEYKLRDYDYAAGINYYRLSQTDNDGTVVQLDVISVDNRLPADEIISVTNLLGQPCSVDAIGVVVIQYANGTVIKKFNN
jgi:hypothetical protein